MTTIYTCQIGDIPDHLVHGRIVDSTVKSGEPEVAPTWDMVMGHKEYVACMNANKPLHRNCLTTKEYIILYNAIIQESLLVNESYFKELMEHDIVVFTCYCNLKKPGIRFCHRLELAKHVANWGMERGYDVIVKDEL